MLASTDRFLMPHDTQLGTGESPPTQITLTIYDDHDRPIATERYTNAIVSPISTLPLRGSSDSEGRAAFQITTPGTPGTVSETLYDAAGRVYRTISGRIPLSSVSLSASVVTQSTALQTYPIYENGTDRYAAQNLTTGVISDTLFDDRGRQHATLGHPLPAADIGLVPPERISVA